MIWEAEKAYSTVIDEDRLLYWKRNYEDDRLLHYTVNKAIN